MQNQKDENRKKVRRRFFISIFILCLKYLMTNDNENIKRLCTLSLYANKLGDKGRE